MLSLHLGAFYGISECLDSVNALPSFFVSRFLLSPRYLLPLLSLSFSSYPVLNGWGKETLGVGTMRWGRKRVDRKKLPDS